MDPAAPLARDPVLLRVLAEARSRAVRALLVGGAVRDARMGRPVKDLDLVVDTARPEAVLDLARALAGALGGTFVPLDPERGIARIVLREGRDLDLAARVGPTLEEDLRHRDFTVNAVAWDPATGELLDPTGGLEDMARGRLREAGPSSLAEDPVRLLRAVRMLCALPLQPAPGLEEALARLAPRLGSVSAERIRDELVACLRAGLSPWWRLVVGTGLLFQVLPELEPAARTPQNHYHHLDVLAHTGEALRLVETFEASGYEELTSHGPRLAQHLARPLAGGRRSAELLKLAVLLHDVGKPATRRDDPSGRIRFPGHAEVGARLAEAAGRRLVLSNRELRRLARLVSLHLWPVLLPERDPSAGELHRLFRAAGDGAPELLVLSAADGGATRGPAQTPERWEAHLRFVREMLDEFFQEGRVVRPKVPLTGADLVATFGLAGGPEVGRLLERVAEAVADGEVRTREEALDLVAGWLSTGG